MHWKELLDATERWQDTAYQEALEHLRWDFPHAEMDTNIGVFERFLKAWNSLRGGGLDEKKLYEIWMSDVELYARELEGELLEALDLAKVIEVGNEKLRVGMAVEHMYAGLLVVPGISHTNASKLLHLRLPNLIVMTDRAVRKDYPEHWFSPYGYAFSFLKMVYVEVSEAIGTLCREKAFTQRKAIDYLRNAHGRRRSLAKLADEYYYMSTR